MIVQQFFMIIVQHLIFLRIQWYMVPVNILMFIFIFFMISQIKEEILELVHRHAQEQVANITTKPLKLDAFMKIRDLLGVYSNPSVNWLLKTFSFREDINVIISDYLLSILLLLCFIFSIVNGCAAIFLLIP